VSRNDIHDGYDSGFDDDEYDDDDGDGYDSGNYDGYDDDDYYYFIEYIIY